MQYENTLGLKWKKHEQVSNRIFYPCFQEMGYGPLTNKQDKILEMTSIVKNKGVTKHLIKVVMIMAIISIVVDLSVLKVYDSHTQKPTFR